MLLLHKTVSRLPLLLIPPLHLPPLLNPPLVKPRTPLHTNTIKPPPRILPRRVAHLLQPARLLRFNAPLQVGYKQALEDGAESEIEISLSGEDESVGAIIKIIRTLAETEWDDLTEDEKGKIQSALNEIEEGIEIDIASNSRGFFDAIVAIVAISFTLGLPIIVIAIILYYKHRKR